MPKVIATSSTPAPSAKVTLPSQSMRALRVLAISFSDLYAQTVPNKPNGRLIQKTARQSQAESRPPSSRPTNWPEMPATWLMPRAVPRWPSGNASVRIAAELAISMDAAECLDEPPADEPQRAVGALERVEGQPDRGEGEDDEAEVVDLHPAEDVAEAAEGDHEDRLHEQVPHDHPQQVGHVAGGERVEVDAAEDGGQRDDHDGAVDRRHDHGEGGVRERYPLVRVAPAGGAAPAGSTRPRAFPALVVVPALPASPVFARRRSHVS